MKNNELVVPELNEDTIKSKIYEIRNQKVMLDFELAEIYGYTTKAFNQQVKNNINKFSDRYRFQLSASDLDDLARSKKLTARMWTIGNTGGRTTFPYAFTEQGIYMLMTVLKGELATKQSIALIDAFKSMKDYIVERQGIDGLGAAIINERFKEHESRLNRIELKLDVVMENFIDPSTYKHYLILDGEKIEADIAYQNIYKLAKHSLYIIDDYVDAKTFKLLKTANTQDIVIMTDNKSKVDIQMLLNDAGINARILKNKRSHDRFIILDYNTKNEKIYLSGASSKDAGNKITTITLLDNPDAYHNIINEMLKQ